ncbi:MAG TPA: L,D-transpeptidase [Paraburkholderia sp.]|nr:L,D-transpeptidase [Paraburkholderia sp.]
MSQAIKRIQDQAASALAANPAVEPHDAIGGPPVFPVGFDFGAARPPATAPSECTKAKRIICVDKTTYTATVYEGGRPQWSFYVRPGDARGTRYQTGEGYGRIARKSRNHVSSIYGTPMPYAMFISWDTSPAAGEAFHLSYQFQSEGYYGASHGCMGVGSEAAMKRLWDTSPKGTRVFVYRT